MGRAPGDRGRFEVGTLHRVTVGVSARRVSHSPVVPTAGLFGPCAPPVGADTLAGGGASVSFLRRLFGTGDREPVQPTFEFRIELSSGGGYQDDELAEVTVGGATIAAAIYRDNQRDVQDWSSGFRLEHPLTGSMLTSDDDYPEYFRAAGARSIAVAGMQHHPDSQGDAFALGRLVRLVPEPTNPVGPDAIAVRSWDGRLLAGYVPEDSLAKIQSTLPAPTVGLVVWDNYTWRPRTRKGLRLLVGPSVGVRMIPALKVPAEQARRAARYEKGRAEITAQSEATWGAYQAERERKAAQIAAWRDAGLCVECGAPVEQTSRRVIRCAVHLAEARTRRLGREARSPDLRYANTVCPYCGLTLDPLPSGKEPCPSCHQEIYVEAGPDGFTYLLQTVDLAVIERAWEEHRASGRVVGAATIRPGPGSAPGAPLSSDGTRTGRPGAIALSGSVAPSRAARGEAGGAGGAEPPPG